MEIGTSFKENPLFKKIIRTQLGELCRLKRKTRNNMDGITYCKI
jgi:hypothetical protein